MAGSRPTSSPSTGRLPVSSAYWARYVDVAPGRNVSPPQNSRLARPAMSASRRVPLRPGRVGHSALSSDFLPGAEGGGVGEVGMQRGGRRGEGGVDLPDAGERLGASHFVAAQRLGRLSCVTAGRIVMPGPDSGWMGRSSARSSSPARPCSAPSSCSSRNCRAASSPSLVSRTLSASSGSGTGVSFGSGMEASVSEVAGERVRQRPHGAGTGVAYRCEG